ncbi:helix-turn-helix domain-containing protein [Nocardia abscessus]|uniref:MmyB family transcriptional regulator n=1 Tax=Nocardia abscessus TaxID=120957 RepID=UPI001894139D|nr:helix-turn-helix domain-containing protein [Nocardia abscessus]MBF6341580.1 helix-turn-helix domain-containing protein [Nocardia abscessus]
MLTSHRADLAVPALGPYLRQIRESIHPPGSSKHLSREKAATRIGLSAAYLRQVEDGTRVPTQQALQLLASGYSLSAAQIRHIRELREPPVPLIGLDTLRARVTQTPALLERLDDLDRADMLAGYFSPLLHVLAANRNLDQALPGLPETGNLALWYFTPAAHEVLIDWDQEATHMVQWLKAILGQHRSTPAAGQLLARLQTDEQFYTRWSDSTAVAYRRDAQRPMILRTGHGEHIAVNVETSTVTDTHGYIRLFLGVRKPPRGDAARIR